MTSREELLKAQQLAISGVLYAPNSFKLASIEELLRVCNGCGAADSWFRPPKRIWGTLIVYACIIHDWMYGKGFDEDDKQEADRVFKGNMNRLVTRDSGKWYKPTKAQRLRVLGYYYAVVWHGHEAFWAGK
jgi:hypothetical protein